VNKFQEQTEQVESNFSNYLENIKESIRFTAITLNLSPDQQFVQLVMDYADAIVYAPMLRHAQRHTFTERMREDGFINFEIINGHKTSEIHPAYLPITRIEPFNVQYIPLLGVDLLNRNDIRQSILSASESGDISMVKLKLVGKKPHYWMFKAIYSGLTGKNDPYFVKHKMEMLNGIVGFQLSFVCVLKNILINLCTISIFHQNKAKIVEKAQFTSVNAHFEIIFNAGMVEKTTRSMVLFDACGIT